MMLVDVYGMAIAIWLQKQDGIITSMDGWYEDDDGCG